MLPPEEDNEGGDAENVDAAPRASTSRVISLPDKAKKAAIASSDDAATRHTDMGNAALLVEHHATSLRYCASWGAWLSYEGGRWTREPRLGCAEQEAAKSVARSLVAAAEADVLAARVALKRASGDEIGAAKDSLEIRRRVLGAAKRAQSYQGLRAMAAIASSDARVAVDHRELDAWPWLLNAPNGTLDLRLGVLRPHNREELHTKLTGAVYDAKAQCPTFDAFLATVQPDAEVRKYLQRLAGYCLTGTTGEQLLHFHFGDGANGKSTYVGALRGVLGEYAGVAARNLLFRGRNERHPTELAALHGLRYVVSSETEEGSAWDEALVKDLTGGDAIACRRMHEDFWSFVPTHKIDAQGNDRPRVKGADHGIWRRLRLVPWHVRVPPSERDHNLPAKLAAEYPGILAWAVRGCLEWQDYGLTPPSSIEDATTLYAKSNDFVGEFLTDYVRKDVRGIVPVAEMRAKYEAFCEESGATPVGASRFNARLEAMGATRGLVRDQGRVFKSWQGVRLL